MTHCRSLNDASSSRPMSGSATFTIVMSSSSMKIATQTTTRAHHRLGSGCAGGPCGPGVMSDMVRRTVRRATCHGMTHVLRRNSAPVPLPSGGRATLRRVLVRDLVDGQEVDQPLLVLAAEIRRRHDGDELLKLSLGDRTGQLAAIVRDGVAAVRERCGPGCVVHVVGRHEVHPRWGAQLAVRALRPAEPGSYAMAELADGPPAPAETMEADLRALVATVQDPHLRALLDRLLGEGTPTWARFRRAPAAKLFHQAYAHGLLEHSLTVAQGVSAMASTFPGIDRDVAVTGALLHDIGKLEAYTTEPPAIEMTDAGKLLGEIPLGYYRVRRVIEQLPGFPADTAQAVLHIILSHHGQLE